MEMNFNSRPIVFMNPLLCSVQSQEQTQEIKMPDGYPDIGKILGCWGQPVIRGKEWHRSSMSTNGGVMAWVMYAPEDGSEVRIVDAWLPFQARWDLPDAGEDGIITVMPLLSELDARNVSARKIILRAGVDVLGHAMERAVKEVAEPVDIPDDLQLLTKSYPVVLPLEAGERQLRIDETLVLPSGKPPIQRLISYELIPTVQEQKVLANRLVFRGNCKLLLRYLDENGDMAADAFEIPFSDYTELRDDHDTTATAWIVPVVTALELDKDENNQLQLRAAIAAQYTVFDRRMLSVTEDAYSPYREVTVQVEELELPLLLDRRELEIPVNATAKSTAQQVYDITCRNKCPYLTTVNGSMSIALTGQCQTLYRGAEENLTSDIVRFEQQMPYNYAEESHIELWPGHMSKCEYQQGVDGLNMKADCEVTAFSYSTSPITMVTGVEIGEQKQSDPDRPSLIVKRLGEEDLWTVAKKYGSTVDAIRTANKLTQDPEEGALLLVPVC